MKILPSLAIALVSSLAPLTTARAKLNVVATLPDFGALAHEIGGDQTEITVLAKPTEDPHFVDPRPSFVVKMRNADVLIEGGAELELGWLPPLLQNARNPKIDVGKPGRVVASSGLRLLNVPSTFDRSKGDIHALGNPHFTVDPIIAKVIAQNIARSFAAIDPTNAAAYEANYKKFEATIDAKLQEWGKVMLPFKGQTIAVYHDSWPYFARRFGLASDVFLEPKPGIPPSPSRLAEVIGQIKQRKIKAVLVEPFHNRKIAEKVAASTGARVVDFAHYPGALPNTESYVALIDTLVARLAAALKE